ncbi:MAG: O-antigen ligase family protein [Undibacterium sp.]|uniref:O-antigen ligase family protein n=1 Tax=Undibacterium sp. TaxID=1914977 RepID=UPI002718550B|nr:O-antigen ligase family protein [Undibacterium sp.]MDO8651965.1 O-antigen ligase family protein [Undibacterium sp.]
MEIVNSSSESSIVQRSIRGLIIFLAISVSLPIAWISLAKTLLLIFGLVLILYAYLFKKSDYRFFGSDMPLASKVALVSVLAFGLSLFYTHVDLSFGWHAFLKHCKFLIFPLLVYFIRDRRTAIIAVSVFLVAQCALIVCSWLIYFGVTPPWSVDTPGKNVVFSSYIDQSIMFTVDAAMLWHLRKITTIPVRLSIFFALAALVNTFLLLEGRTGYVVALITVGLAAMWAVPRRLQLIALVLTPLLLVSALFITSTQIQTRVNQVFKGASEFSTKHDQATSEGWRLNAWSRSIQAISGEPLLGYGAGSWSYAVKKMEGQQGDMVFGKTNSSNPHQEYLLWGVELGLMGIALLCTFIASAAWEVRLFSPPVARACWSILAVTSFACLFNSALYDDLIGDYLLVALGLTMAVGVKRVERDHEC